MAPAETTAPSLISTFGPQVAMPHLSELSGAEPTWAFLDGIDQSRVDKSTEMWLDDIEKKLREGKGKGYEVWATRNNIDAKAQSVIFLKENHIGSIHELDEQIRLLRSERNAIYASIRQTQQKAVCCIVI